MARRLLHAVPLSVRMTRCNVTRFVRGLVRWFLDMEQHPHGLYLAILGFELFQHQGDEIKPLRYRLRVDDIVGQVECRSLEVQWSIDQTF